VTYLGVEEVPALPFDLFGSWPAVIGRDDKSRGVFSVVEVDGAPAIRISGEVWGALISEDEFANYRLRLEYKWGEERHAPRAEAPRNTGLLYHSVGPDGAFWSYWMRAGEFEIMEGHTGDFTSVDGVEGLSHTIWDSEAGYPWLRFAPNTGEDAPNTEIGGLSFRIAASADHERPRGQWNQLELVVREDSALHIVNGETVFAVQALQHEVDGKLVPLTRGRLQLQSEGAEVFFRKIELEDIESIDARP